ncbi:TIGR03089 family protein [Phytomonospora sp. NPDC050363]|uniref:TIGR03089 family protein n=1 Tax=Phytomonospora sp. NPDC050363 TaxID=3155642 RepID=UPI0033E2F097
MERVNIPQMFAAATGGDAARPFITYYDDATGERVELSYLTVANWTNKTANLLVDGSGLGPGSTAAVAMPAHWLTAALLLGCWSAGVAVAHETADVDVAFVGGDRFGDAPKSPETYGVSLKPMAFRLDDAPEGIVDFLTEVRNFGDHFGGSTVVGDDDPALVALPGGGARTQAELVASGGRRAGELEVAAGARILLAGDRLRPLDWLLMPLAVGGSVVLCRNSDGVDLDARAATEKAVRVDVS